MNTAFTRMLQRIASLKHVCAAHDAKQAAQDLAKRLADLRKKLRLSP